MIAKSPLEGTFFAYPRIEPVRQFILSKLQFLAMSSKIRGVPRIALMFKFIIVGTGTKIIGFDKRFRFIANLDDSYDVLLGYGFVHRAMGELFKKLFSKIDGTIQFLDVGANIGFVSLLACSIGHGKVQAHCFEPEPNTFKRLQDNANLNNFSMVLIECALGENMGNANLFVNEHSGNSGFLVSEDSVLMKTVINTVEVPIRTLDNYCNEEKIQPDIIKIDVEGYERFVINGGEKIIKTTSPYLIVEVNPRTLMESGFTPYELLNMIKKLGYCTYYIDQDQMVLSDEVLKSRSKWSGLFEALSEDSNGKHLFDVVCVPFSRM